MTKIINEITAEHRAKLDQIDRDCIAMHIPTPPKTFINMQVKDKDGNLLTDYSLPSKSWVRNAYNILASQFMGCPSATGGTTFGEGKLPLKNIGGGVLQGAYTMSACDYYWAADIGETNRGIVVGTGTTAESFESYALATMIATGTSSGQMSYAAQAGPSASYDSGTKKMTVTVSRIINNNSGESISVTETAIHERVTLSSAYVMMCRDLLASAVAVPNGGQLTVTYTIEQTFPA